MLSLLSSQLSYNEPAFIEKVSLRQPSVFKVPHNQKKADFRAPLVLFIYERNFSNHSVNHLVQGLCTPTRGRPARNDVALGMHCSDWNAFCWDENRHHKITSRLLWCRHQPPLIMPYLQPLAWGWLHRGSSLVQRWMRPTSEWGHMLGAKGLGYTPSNTIFLNLPF